ncbi:MAG TPA: CAP domain-containing protein [Clostridia bacterium]|nr:CAP domain-containing protein [Clostridia bacterium]
MKRCKVLFSTVVIMLIFTLIFGGCTYEPARRYMQTDPNDMAAPNNQTLPNNLVGRNGGNNAGDNFADKISSTFEMVDFSNLGITTDSLTVRSGAGAKYPSIGTLKSGQKIRALGKMDGWYVVKLPDSGKIGCIQADYAKPYGTGTTPTDANTATGTRTTAQAPGTGTTTGGGARAGTTGGGAAATGSGTMTSDESRILQLVNAERAKTGAKALASNSDCTKLARMKSQDMVNKNYFSHQSPTYGSPFDMLKSYKVSYMYAGENIAMNQNADAAFKAWMNSEGHKKNILNPNFTELGVGIAPKGDGSNIYTQLFIGK